MNRRNVVSPTSFRRKIRAAFSAPTLPGASTDETVAAETFHRLLLFSFSWQAAMIVLAATTKPSDLLLECFGVVLLSLAVLLQRRFSTAHAYAYWCVLAFAVHIPPLFGPLGIHAPGLMTVVSVLIGSAIVFREGFIVSALLTLGTVCTLVAALQHFGYWANEPASLPVADAFRVLLGRGMNYTMRVWLALSAYQAAERALTARAAALMDANDEKRRILQQEERLFWNLSHELNSPLARLQLHLRSELRQAGAEQKRRILNSKRLIAAMAQVIRQALQIAQLRHPVPISLEERVDFTALLQDLCRQGEENPQPGSALIRMRVSGVHWVRGSAELLRTALEILLQQARDKAQQAEISVVLDSESADHRTICISCPVGALPHAGQDLDSPVHADLAFSLATEIVAAHGGNITQGPADQGHMVLRILLPRASTEPDEKQVGSLGVIASGRRRLLDIFSLSHLSAEQCIGSSLKWLLLFLCLWGPAVTCASLLTSQDAVAAMSGVLVTLGAIAIRWIHRKLGLRPAFVAFQIAAISGLLLAILRVGGIQSPATHSIITLLLAGILIFRKRSVVLAMASLFAGYGLLAYVQSQDLWTPARISLTPVAGYLFFILNIVTVWFLLLPSIYRYRWANKRLDQQLAELEAARQVKDKLIEGQRDLYGTLLRALTAPVQDLCASLDDRTESVPPSAPLSPNRSHMEAAHLRRLMRQLAVLADLRTEPLRAPSRVSVSALLQEVCTDAEFEAQQTGRELSYRPADCGYLMAPEGMLRASFGNILRNAIRFAPLGSSVEVSATRTDSRRIRITVEDRGPGVPEEMLSKIFEPFVRLDPNAPAEGGGLGLSIAKYTVEGCGGTITASNRPGGGLKVVVELPEQPESSAS